LSRSLELVGEGITISPLQAARANQLFETSKAEHLRCREGNFLALPPDLKDIDLAFSIEAFVHSPDVVGYFSEAARVLRSGGKLIVCDDFLTQRASVTASARELARLEDFRRGWRIGSLVTVESACQLAGTVGLACVKVLDLTSYLELRRPRDLVISLLTWVGRRLGVRGEYWNAMIGGDALQRLLHSGAISYSVLIFERQPIATCGPRSSIA
jgi:SAM-dependent methyltransferase